MQKSTKSGARAVTLMRQDIAGRFFRFSQELCRSREMSGRCFRSQVRAFLRLQTFRNHRRQLMIPNLRTKPFLPPSQWCRPEFVHSNSLTNAGTRKIRHRHPFGSAGRIRPACRPVRLSRGASPKAKALRRPERQARRLPAPFPTACPMRRSRPAGRNDFLTARTGTAPDRGAVRDGIAHGRASIPRVGLSAPRAAALTPSGRRACAC